ncbi:MAG: hypothetical protein R3304_02050 [Longimicrobiales bacterium]|nr:hypothetical protein [Longimicrobiales bacterium]
MTTHFRRRRPGTTEKVGAAAVGLLVGMSAGAVAFYLTRLFLSREPLSSPDAGEDVVVLESRPTKSDGPAPTRAFARTD